MSAAMIAQSVERLFADSVNRALMQAFEAGEPPAALWQQCTEQGLTLALATEAAGGIAASWSDAYAILHGLGYWQVPLPVAETMIASLLLSLAGVTIPHGAITLIESGPDGVLQASAIPKPGDDSLAAGMHLNGHVQRVPWASACQWALVSLPAPGSHGSPGDGPAQRSIGVVDLHDADSATVSTRLNMAGEPSDEVELRDAPCLYLVPNPLPGLDLPLRTLGAITRSVMMVGAMEWLLAQAVQYANDRLQFGRPIGKNQAIQQQLALMAGDVAAARVAALVACADAPCVGALDTPATLFSAAAAKIVAGESATRATSIAHQVHGAIGFTQEHALHFATRRLWAWREAYGADAWWAQRLGAAAIGARAAGFWPAITNRHFNSLRG